MLEASKYIKAIGVGVTKPHLLRASDGHLYVVKLTNNKLGTKALANEYIGSRLGEYMQLSFPKAGFINITEAALEKMRPLRRLGTPPGLHFAVRYLKHCEYVRPWHIRQAVNRHEFAGVILFDHILQNEDRTLNQRNILARHEAAGIKLYAIDNTHLFGSGCWRSDNLTRYADVIRINNRLAYGVLLKRYLRSADFKPYMERIAALTPDKIKAILDDIPSAWLDESDRQTAEAVIARRISLTEQIVEALSLLIPDKHRRANCH